jgi:hypothetical protein
VSTPTTRPFAAATKRISMGAMLTGLQARGTPACPIGVHPVCGNDTGTVNLALFAATLTP